MDMFNGCRHRITSICSSKLQNLVVSKILYKLKPKTFIIFTLEALIMLSLWPSDLRRLYGPSKVWIAKSLKSDFFNVFSMF